eukprot:scaffold1084_cov250-Ochromonas_danica.AAC.2
MNSRGKRKASQAVSYHDLGDDDDDHEYVESEDDEIMETSMKVKAKRLSTNSTTKQQQQHNKSSSHLASTPYDGKDLLDFDEAISAEAFSPLYQQACDFLVAIAEPESRPAHIHIYRLTENSLYAAVAVSITTDAIIKVLNKLCKTEVPNESKYPDVLRELLRNPVIRSSRETKEDNSNTNSAGNGSSNAATGGGGGGGGGEPGFVESTAPVEDMRNLDYMKLGLDEGEGDEDEDEAMDGGEYRSRLQTVSFMVKQKDVQIVKRSAKEDSNYPLMEEYDFKNDHRNPILTIDLRPSTKIRPYQEKSLAKLFGNGRARSGIIVLPCGAGKSLTGVTAASTIKRSTMVMCINNASVKQWKEQFMMWTNVAESNVKLFTSVDKDVLPPPSQACIVISTYSMICHSGRRSDVGEAMIQSVRNREWGLMILDEVHVAPADMFQKVVELVNAHCKLGLTATLVREDRKIQDLNFLVGPKLYEANWIDLTAQGYLAKVQCVEVWCPMTREFYAEYISHSTGSRSRVQRLLYTLNPRKFRSCEYLVNYHVKRGDKIIIFSDDVPALILYCEALQKVVEVPYIYGGTREDERRDILTAFKLRPEVSCIGLSKVGDTALDIPEANVIIQVSSHFGARRQEAQRLGRILRPKPNPTGGYNAFFYTLISTDTKEMYFSSKRQQYLIDQGYTFKVVQDLADLADKESTLLTSVQQERDLLAKVLMFNYAQYDKEEEKQLTRKTHGEVEEEDVENNNIPKQARRKTSSMGAKSGMGGTLYVEYQA